VWALQGKAFFQLAAQIIQDHQKLKSLKYHQALSHILSGKEIFSPLHFAKIISFAT
jgi:hypothetical protein